MCQFLFLYANTTEAKRLTQLAVQVKLPLLLRGLDAELLPLLGDSLLLKIVLRLILRDLRGNLLPELRGLILDPLRFEPKFLLADAQLLQPRLLILGQLEPKLLSLLSNALALQLVGRDVLRLRHGNLPALQCRFLLQLLDANPQFLRRQPKLLDARRLLFGQLQTELLPLLRNTLPLNGIARLVLGLGN